MKYSKIALNALHTERERESVTPFDISDFISSLTWAGLLCQMKIIDMTPLNGLVSFINTLISAMRGILQIWTGFWS